MGKAANGSRVERWAGIIFSCVLPVFVIISGIITLVGGTVFNFTAALMIIILPLVAISANIVLIHLVDIKWVTIFLCIVILVVLIFFELVILIFGCHIHRFSYYQEEATKEYSEFQGKSPVFSEIPMPEADDVFEYHEFTNRMAIFISKSHYAVYKYNADDYLEYKDKLDEEYVFENGMLYASDHSCESKITIDGYDFRMLSFQTKQYSSLRFPKYMVLIATNDQTKEIVYLYFKDLDLDYFYNLEEFILEVCCFKYIR